VVCCSSPDCSRLPSPYSQAAGGLAPVIAGRLRVRYLECSPSANHSANFPTATRQKRLVRIQAIFRSYMPRRLQRQVTSALPSLLTTSLSDSSQLFEISYCTSASTVLGARTVPATNHSIAFILSPSLRGIYWSRRRLKALGQWIKPKPRWSEAGSASENDW